MVRRICTDGVKSVGAEKSILRPIKLVPGIDFWVGWGEEAGREARSHRRLWERLSRGSLSLQRRLFSGCSGKGSWEVLPCTETPLAVVSEPSLFPSSPFYIIAHGAGQLSVDLQSAVPEILICQTPHLGLRSDKSQKSCGDYEAGYIK